MEIVGVSVWGISKQGFPCMTGVSFKQVDAVTVTGSVPFDGETRAVGVLPDGTPVFQNYSGTWSQCLDAKTGKTWAVRRPQARR